MGKALLYLTLTTLTIKANYFTLTIIWKHVASSFWCVFFLSQSPVKHYRVQPFGVSVGLHGRRADRWGASIDQEGEEMQTRKKKQQNWSNSERKEGHESLTEGEKHRVGKSRKDTVDYRTDLPICAVGTVGSSHAFSHCLDAQSHTLRHTHLLRRDTWLLWPI